MKVAVIFLLGSLSAQAGLVGQWKYECGFILKFLNTTMIEELKGSLSGDSDDCSKADLKTVVYKKYEASDFTEGVIGNLDMVYNYSKVTALTTKAVDTMNTVGYCGITDWELNRERTCRQREGETSYSIYRVQGNQLQLGDRAGTTPDRRPTDLSDAIFVKQ